MSLAHAVKIWVTNNDFIINYKRTLTSAFSLLISHIFALETSLVSASYLLKRAGFPYICLYIYNCIQSNIEKALQYNISLSSYICVSNCIFRNFKNIVSSIQICNRPIDNIYLMFHCKIFIIDWLQFKMEYLLFV